MDTNQEKFDEKTLSRMAEVAGVGINNAVEGISRLVGESLTVSTPSIHVAQLTEIPDLLGGPEAEAVGIYLRAEGLMSGQIMMVIPCPKALELVDLLMDFPPGTTDHLGKLERSALAELGNITCSYFLNAISDSTGISIRPSPPAVIVDMIGSILDIILATADGLTETVLMIHATFERDGRGTQANFWVIPDKNAFNPAAGREE